MPEKQYIVSLDSLDLSFLSKYVEKTIEDKQVLWSRPSLREETTYYEVELFPDETPDEDSFVIPETFETYKCHICNTDVPEIYYKQHIKSKKHQNYKRLSQLVLEKVSKQIHFDVDNTFGNDAKSVITDKFYCEQCSVVFPKEHKAKHNKSHCHLNSMENDKMIDNFIEMYKEIKQNTAETVERKSESQHSNTKKDNTNKINPENNPLSDVEIKENQCINSSDIIFINSVTNIDALVNKTVDREIGNSHKDDNKAFNANGTITADMNKDIDTHKLYDESSDTDWSQSDNETELYSGIDLTNKISGIPQTKPDDISIKLDISSLTLKDKNDADITDFITYMKDMIKLYDLNYNLPSVEGNSIVIVTPKGFKEKVTVDVFHGFNRLKAFVYCQLCNKFIDVDTKQHRETANHLKNITKPVNDEFVREMMHNEKWVHCLLCNQVVLAGSNHHTAAHSNHKKCTQENKITNTDVNTPETSNNIPKKIYCLVCKVHIDNHNYLGHTKGKKHTLKSVSDNTNPSETILQLAQDIETYCDICNVNIPKDGRAVHEAGKPHINKLTILTNKKVYGLSKSVKEKGTNVGGMSPNPSDAFSMAIKVIEYNKQVLNYSDTEVECIICNVKISILKPNIIQHMEGLKHRTAVETLLSKHNILKLSMNEYNCQVCDIDLDDFVDHIFVDENSRHDINLQMKNGQIDKEVLKKYVYDDPADDFRAIHYRQIHEELLKKNRIIPIPLTSEFNCEVCSIRLTRISEIYHMYGERHKKCLISQKKLP